MAHKNMNYVSEIYTVKSFVVILIYSFLITVHFIVHTPITYHNLSSIAVDIYRRDPSSIRL